jgi:hypothetical protein
MVLYQLKIVHAAVLTVTGNRSRHQTPDQNLCQHILEIIVLDFAFAFVVNAKVNEVCKLFDAKIG